MTRLLPYCHLRPLLPVAACVLILVCAGPPVALGSSGVWAKQPSGTLAWLHAVYFLDINRGWAVGGDGALLATTDGGRTWHKQPRPTQDALLDVYFSSAEVGWLVCERSIYLLRTKDEPRAYLLKTVDGGATWTRVEVTGQEVDVRLVRILFADDERGWVFGEEGALYVTRDGGASWSRQRVPTRHLLLGGVFLNQLQGWLVGAGATVLQTTNSGETWRAGGPVVTTGGPAARLNGVSFVDGRRGWAVGSGGLVLATTDGGRSWRAQTSNVAADLFDVKFFDAAEGWAVGAEGTVIHTTDGGRNWQSEKSDTAHPLERLCFVGRTRGWAVGFGGTIIAYGPATNSAPPEIKPSNSEAARVGQYRLR